MNPAIENEMRQSAINQCEFHLRVELSRINSVYYQSTLLLDEEPK